MKKTLVIGILTLFLLSSLTQISIGRNFKELKDNKLIPTIIIKNNSNTLMQNTDIVSNRWINRFGRAEDDHGESVRQTSDGGYFIVGETDSDDHGGLSDAYIIKTNSNGDEQWNKTFGGPGIQRDEGLFGIPTLDGGYIITGATGGIFGTWLDLWIIKTDYNGEIIWDRVYSDDDFEWGKCIQQTLDGGYIVVGMNRDNVWLIKIDENGYKEWDKIFAGYGICWGEHVQQTKDGGYILVARTNAYGNGSYDAWMIKTDNNGDIQLNLTYGGTDYDLGKCVIQNTEGQYVIVGTTKSFGAGEEDIWLIKTDIDGNEIWTKTYGGPYYDNGESIQQTLDGGYIITGETESYGAGARDVWLIKIDENGNEEWNSTFGGTDHDFGECVQQTYDDGYIITGETQSFGNLDGDVWLIKTDENGFVSNTPGIPTISGPTIGDEKINYKYNMISIDPDDDNLYYLVDWGDGTKSGWLGPFNSGDVIQMSHIWTSSSEYFVKVCSKDVYGVESGWSEPLIVDIFTKKTFMVGLISNLNKTENVSSFNAIMIFWLSYNPFKVKIFSSSEKIIISNNYQGYVGTFSIIGKFNMLVVSKST